MIPPQVLLPFLQDTLGSLVIALKESPPGAAGGKHILVEAWETGETGGDCSEVYPSCPVREKSQFWPFLGGVGGNAIKYYFFVRSWTSTNWWPT